MGLSLVKSLQLYIGSDIELKIEVRKGSKFYFDLIYKQNLKKQMQPLINKEEFVDLSRNKKVLLVEDNAINKLVTQKFLSPYNIELVMISDGKEAYEALLENEYDVVLLDINIPSMSGYEIAKEVRDRGVNVPIIAVTASELSEIEERVYNIGMNDIIIKPFQKQKLIDTLSKFFAQTL